MLDLHAAVYLPEKVKGSSQQRGTSGPKVKGGVLYFQEESTYCVGWGGSLNDTTPVQAMISVT